MYSYRFRRQMVAYGIVAFSVLLGTLAIMYGLRVFTDPTQTDEVIWARMIALFLGVVSILGAALFFYLSLTLNRLERGAIERGL